MSKNKDTKEIKVDWKKEGTAAWLCPNWKKKDLEKPATDHENHTSSDAAYTSNTDTNTDTATLSGSTPPDSHQFF